jgi:hypothetical protein
MLISFELVIATVEDYFRLGWNSHAKRNHNNEPVDRKMVVDRTREHLRIADKFQCEIFGTYILFRITF